MDKKRAAAILGVMYYLQQEADESGDESARAAMRRSSSGWSAYGRKAVARGRQMVQGRRIRRFSGTSNEQNFRLRVKKNASL